MSKELKTYRVMYRPFPAQANVAIIYCTGRSKAEVLMDLVNCTDVYNLNSIERLKDD